MSQNITIFKMEFHPVKVLFGNYWFILCHFAKYNINLNWKVYQSRFFAIVGTVGPLFSSFYFHNKDKFDLNVYLSITPRSPDVNKPVFVCFYMSAAMRVARQYFHIFVCYCWSVGSALYFGYA
jgi:hypothetical protein